MSATPTKTICCFRAGAVFVAQAARAVVIFRSAAARAVVIFCSAAAIAVVIGMLVEPHVGARNRCRGRATVGAGDVRARICSTAAKPLWLECSMILSWSMQPLSRSCYSWGWGSQGAFPQRCGDSRCDRDVSRAARRRMQALSRSCYNWGWGSQRAFP